MNIREIKATPFRIPFVRPLLIGKSTVEAHTGVLIRLYDEGGRVGLGEAAPHPLAGDLALRDMIKSIAAAREALSLLDPTELHVVRDRLEAVPTPVRAGTEAACWDLAAQEAGVPLAQMLSSDRSSRVPLLTKEGSGEVLQWRVSDLPLAPSLAETVSKREPHPSRRSQEKGPPQGERNLFFENNNRTARPEEPPAFGGVSKGARWRESTLSARRGSSGPTPRRRVPVNAMIDMLGPDDAASAARELVSQGFRCLKLKVGRDFGKDVARLAAVRAAAGPRVRLRIDANGVWTLREAVEFLPGLAAYDLEYVEQPVADMAKLAQVRRAVGVPIAADECVTDADAVRQLAALGAADVVVVKPALLGLHAAVSVVRMAQACGLGVVVTSALDTSIGIAAALHLAATLPDPVLPCGLATASLLAGDLANDAPTPRGGWLEVPPGPGLGVHLDAERLQRWRME